MYALDGANGGVQRLRDGLVRLTRQNLRCYFAVSLREFLHDFERLSSADGSRDGVCDESGGVDGSVLWGDGGVAGEICVVRQEFSGEDVAGREFEAE